MLARPAVAFCYAQGPAASTTWVRFSSGVGVDALFVVPLFVLLAPWSAGGDDREDVALSYVYAYSGCVCGSQLAVCLVSLFVSVCRSCVSSSSV